MVLFIDIVRKFSFKYFSQYIHEITKSVINAFVKDLPEAVDDDLRGLGALSMERIGHADNLSTATLLTKGQQWKSIYEGGQTECALWLYMNDVNSPNQKDQSGWSGATEISLGFDGTNEYLNCGNHATLWSQSLTKFSMSFWIWPEVMNDGTTRLVVNHGNGAQRFNCHIHASTAGRIIFRIVNAAAANIDAFNDTLKLRQWNHIVCVYDNSLGSANLKIYVNGVVGTNANLTEAINQSADLLLGGDTVTGIQGNVKDFRFWPTTALTASDVSGLFKLSPQPTPSYWLKINEGTGNDPVDAIAGKTTTRVNGPGWRPKDYTKTISRIGNPCVVKTAQNFIGRKLVGYFNGIDDGLKITDHEDLRMINNPAGLSVSYWLYVPTGADTINPAFVSKNSIALDGVNDLIDCTNDATLWSQSLTKFSFAFWFYPTIIGDGSNSRWVISHGGSSNQGFRCIHETDGKITFVIKDSGGTSFIASSNSSLTPNQWYYVTCVYDNSLGSANLKVYINGVQQTTTANLTAAINLSATLEIGSSTNDAKGNIKDFKWWTTRPLTASQVDAYYRGFIWNENTPPDYYLAMSEGTGNPVDSISGSKVGTLTNGAAWVTDIYPPYVETLPATIYKKEDDSSKGITIFLDPVSKRLVLQVRDVGVFLLQKIDNAYAYNTWTYHVIEFNPTTDAFTFYKDGVSQTITSADTPVNYDLAIVDAFIANTGVMYGASDGVRYSNLALYNFKFWKNKLLSAGEVINEITNKFTISNITISERPVADFMTTTSEFSVSGFTKEGFSAMGFTTPA